VGVATDTRLRGLQQATPYLRLKSHRAQHVVVTLNFAVDKALETATMKASLKKEVIQSNMEIGSTRLESTREVADC
jgi:hypothetical protein